MHQIFVLDDDIAWLGFVQEALNDLGQTDFETFTSTAALAARLRRTTPDLIILDWNLPENTGLDMVRLIREELSLPAPIIMLTARESSDDIVRALDCGADDYLTKPINGPELVARVRALLRRSRSSDIDEHQETHAGVKFNLRLQTADRTTDGSQLTSKEFALALLLFQRIGSPVSRETIYSKIWHGEPTIQSRTVDAHITNIRRKMKLRPEHGFRLMSVYGFGYRLEKMEPEID